MHHSEYEFELLAQQRSAELIAEAAHLNQLHELRRRRRRNLFRSLLARFRRPAPVPPVIDVRDPAPAPAPAIDPLQGTPGPVTGLPS